LTSADVRAFVAGCLLLFRILVFAVCVGVLTACSSSSESALNTIKLALKGGDFNAPLSEPVNSAFRYLKVTVYGRTAYLVLGYFEPSNRTEVWFSAKGEVIKLQEGRLVGALGLETEWRQVQYFSLPTWSEVLDKHSEWSGYFDRVRDVMPGYTVNVHDRLSLTQVSYSKVQNRLGALINHIPANADLFWFEESGADGLPTALYALHQTKPLPKVVLTYQCITSKLCLMLEPWEPRKSGSNDKAIGVVQVFP
jgi:hypothetical protein